MLVESAQKIIHQIHHFSSSLGQEKFCKKIADLSDSTIGQHVRHVVEFFGCLLEGYESGIVNYDKRKHDKNLEENLSLVLHKLTEIQTMLPLMNLQKKLELHCNYSMQEEKPVAIQTLFERELAYNIEHAVHHMAIMKIGVALIAPEVPLDSDFGVAVSTLKYKQNHVHSNFSA